MLKKGRWPKRPKGLMFQKGEVADRREVGGVNVKRKEGGFFYLNSTIVTPKPPSPSPPSLKLFT